jgi:tetratricopeptide (TPR) repeat protein
MARFIFILFFASFSTISSQSKEIFSGDYFYNQGKYKLAILEYERTVFQNPQDDISKAKLALSYMRENNYSESLKFLDNDLNYSHLYLRLFGSMKTNLLGKYSDDFLRIEESLIYSFKQKEKTKLLAGTIMLEEMRLKEATDFYTKLKESTKYEDIKKNSEQILNAIKTFNTIPRKSPILGGLFSAVLPGAGQMYSGHYIDGVLAFIFNFAFLGSAAYMYGLENSAHRNHDASIALGTVGFAFYGANIIGGIGSAQRYNSFYERKFFQNIQENFFNLNTVEKYSEIKFKTDF